MMTSTWYNDPTVAVVKARDARYPSAPPFHPGERFPELSFLPDFQPDRENVVYSAVRDALALLTRTIPGEGWNPLAWLVRPGDTVVLKPNFIRERHETRPDEWEQVITHGAVIRAVCDYVLMALEGKGRVIICDAPQTDSSFNEICRVSGTADVVEWYRTWSDMPVDLLDLRREEWTAKDDVIISRRQLPGDPDGYVAVDLGKGSEFCGIAPKHGFYGADYDTDITNQHHHDDVHEYLLSRTVMKADVVINLPKLKTHKKTGITCALKNLVGINGDKNWLPHYILGSPENGGDQFPKATARTRVERVLMSWFKKRLHSSPAWLNHLFRPVKAMGKLVFGHTHKVIRSGNWRGNDTTWRMVVDLNKCFFYGMGCENPQSAIRDPQSEIRNPQSAIRNPKSHRRYLTLVDGIIAGEGDGPLAPDAKECGVIVGGKSPVAVDAVCAWLMGFEVDKLRLISGSFEGKELPLCGFDADDVEVTSGVEDWRGKLENLRKIETFNFKPHFGWVGAIERSSEI